MYIYASWNIGRAGVNLPYCATLDSLRIIKQRVVVIEPLVISHTRYIKATTGHPEARHGSLSSGSLSTGQ